MSLVETLLMICQVRLVPLVSVQDRGRSIKKPIEHNFQAHFATLLIVSHIVDGSYVKHQREEEEEILGKTHTSSAFFYKLKVLTKVSNNIIGMVPKALFDHLLT